MPLKNLPLFPTESAPSNILPYDGVCTYYGPIYTAEEADAHLRSLLADTPWKNDEMTMYGKHIVTERKIAWYGFRSYSTEQSYEWTPHLLQIKQLVEEVSSAIYNSCLLNLYENGGQGLGWHHDNEKEIAPDSPIASLSFGAERRFDLRHDETKETVSIQLEHGSLLIMGGTTQSHWRHQVPKSKKVLGPRINLTFRQKIGIS